jgi:hypothetical protein
MGGASNLGVEKIHVAADRAEGFAGEEIDPGIRDV